jgi:nucleoside-diphosphate-sugar epimerase
VEINMFQPVRNFKLSQALPRVLADFLNVHFCMITALGAPTAILLLRSDINGATAHLHEAIVYYSSRFALLSLLFPLAFLLNGFYTHSLGYVGRYKVLVILRGAGFGILLFLAAHFIFFRRMPVPRSALPLFCGLAMMSLAVPRIAKAALLDSFEIKPKNGKGESHSDGVVLVVGGAGYIGSILVRKLLEAGRKVRVMDSLIYGSGAIRDLVGQPNFELRVGDCRKIQDIIGAVKGAESVIHLAAIVGDPACEVDRNTSLQINYAATRMLIEVAKGSGIRRLVFASSCSVYGTTDLLMDESSIVQPVSLYGHTKVDSEQALLRASTDSFHPVILRLATVFGLSYRPRFDLVVNLLTAKACKEGAITIFNGTQWRPFIHVRDVAEGMIRALNAPISMISGEIYNLGDTRMNFTLTQVAEKILAAFPGTTVEQIKNSDRRNYRVSFYKIRNQLGFECSLSLDDGVLELRRAFEQSHIENYKEAKYYNQQFLKLSGSPSCKDELDEHVMAAFAQAPTPSDKPASVLPALVQAAWAGR